MKCYMKYAVNEAGVSALQNISTALMNSVADLFEKTSQLQTITSDNEDSLGPHKASLNQAIMEIYIGLKESAESISTLAASAKDIAEAYQEIIDNDYLSSTAESSAGTAAGTGGIGSTHAAGVVAPADRIKTCGREWTESLSKENKAAIHSYTGTAYSNINARLRGLEKSFDPGNQECALEYTKLYRAHRFPPTVLYTVAYRQKHLECCECCQIICWLERHSQTTDL